MPLTIFQYTLKVERNDENTELTITDITGTYPATVTGWSGYDGPAKADVLNSGLKILDLDTGEYYEWVSTSSDTLDLTQAPYDFPSTNTSITLDITDTDSEDTTWGNNLRLVNTVYLVGTFTGTVIATNYEFYNVEQCVADLNYRIASGTSCKADRDNYTKIMSWYLGYTDAISAGDIDTAYSYSLKIYGYCNGSLGGCNCGV